MQKLGLIKKFKDKETKPKLDGQRTPQSTDEYTVYLVVHEDGEPVLDEAGKRKYVKLPQ